jgi:hypothetical protein
MGLFRNVYSYRHSDTYPITALRYAMQQGRKRNQNNKSGYICFTTGISTLAHLLPHVTSRRFPQVGARLAQLRLWSCSRNDAYIECQDMQWMPIQGPAFLSFIDNYIVRRSLCPQGFADNYPNSYFRSCKFTVQQSPSSDWQIQAVVVSIVVDWHPGN